MGDIVRGTEALRSGSLTRHQLERRVRVLPNVYAPRDSALTLRDRAVAAWLWSGRRAVIAGVAAAGVHGARWIDDDEPVELIWRHSRPPGGLIVRNETLLDGEVTEVAGLPVTTPARTAYDLGRYLPRGLAVARLDALMRATPFTADDVVTLKRKHRGARNLRRLESALPLVDGGAASPRETWLRLLVIGAGLPTPTTQIPLHTANGLLAVLAQTAGSTSGISVVQG